MVMVDKKQLRVIAKRFAKSIAGNYDPYTICGIRVNHPKDRQLDSYPACEIGDVLPPSHVADRTDFLLDQILPGTSVIYIETASALYVGDLYRACLKALENLQDYIWGEDDIILLVKGDFVDYGPDGECLLDSPQIIDKYVFDERR